MCYNINVNKRETNDKEAIKMKKVINGTLCNTETAKLLGSFENECYPGDIRYIREALYRTKSGTYFLHAEGGAGTRYAQQIEPNHWRSGEMITVVSPASAKMWAEEHLDADEYARAFGPTEDKAVISVPASTKAKLDEIKAKTGMTISKIVTDAVDNAKTI